MPSWYSFVFLRLGVFLDPLFLLHACVQPLIGYNVMKSLKGRLLLG